MDENEGEEPETLDEIEGLSQILRQCPEKIRQSPNAGYYVDGLRKGWTLRKCAAVAKEQFNEEISRQSFHRLRKLIPDKHILERKIKDVYLKGLEPTIDVLQDIYDMIEIQKQRVGRALDYEERMSLSAILPAFMKPAGQEMDRWLDMLRTLAAVQQFLGLLQGGAPGIQAPPKTTHELARTLADDMPPEQRDAWLEHYDAKQRRKELGIQDAEVETEDEAHVEETVTVSDSATVYIIP